MELFPPPHMQAPTRKNQKGGKTSTKQPPLLKRSSEFESHEYNFGEDTMYIKHRLIL